MWYSFLLKWGINVGRHSQYESYTLQLISTSCFSGTSTLHHNPHWVASIAKTTFKILHFFLFHKKIYSAIFLNLTVLSLFLWKYYLQYIIRITMTCMTESYINHDMDDVKTETCTMDMQNTMYHDMTWH